MEKIENLLYNNLISLENNLIRLINNNSKENTSTKFRFSRNLFLKNKNKIHPILIYIKILIFLIIILSILQIKKKNYLKVILIQ